MLGNKEFEEKVKELKELSTSQLIKLLNERAPSRGHSNLVGVVALTFVEPNHEIVYRTDNKGFLKKGFVKRVMDAISF